MSKPQSFYGKQDIPRLHQPLEFQDGLAYLAKTDILAQTMYFTYEKGSLSMLYPLKASEVKEIMELNRKGIKPETIKPAAEAVQKDFVATEDTDDISRFDNKKAAKKKHRHNNRKRKSNE